MQLTLHTDLSEIPSDAWNQLASAGISDTPFARHEYLSQWWTTLGGGEWAAAEMVLVSARDGNRQVGLAPLFKALHEGQEKLLFIGSIEISDYLDLLVPADDLRRFAGRLLDFLEATPALAGLPLDLFNIADSSPTLPALKEESERRGWAYHQEIFRPTPRIRLSADFESYLGSLGKKQRHEIRRKLRRASEGPEPARFELLSDPGALDRSIDAFLDLMAHDPDKASFLTPPMRTHMRSLMQVAWQGGYLWMAFLTVDTVKAAAAVNFDYGNKLWGYNSAVNRDFLELSPGWVLLAHQLRWACEHGRTVFDFMRGDEEYKYRFGAQNAHVMRAVIVPR
jgi:CelD/BcsL family acetyltransferase involved in cellulose biosynthesis